MKTLTQSYHINSERHSPPTRRSSDLAMTHHQLGHKAQAAATLARLREAMKKPEWATNEDAKDFLQEAETLKIGRASCRERVERQGNVGARQTNARRREAPIQHLAGAR